MENKKVNAKRCIICQKADYGENLGLEKVEECPHCKSPVCVRCKGKCCKSKEDEFAQK
jgi:hypothetical protein